MNYISYCFYFLFSCQKKKLILKKSSINLTALINFQWHQLQTDNTTETATSTQLQYQTYDHTITYTYKFSIWNRRPTRNTINLSGGVLFVLYAAGAKTRFTNATGARSGSGCADAAAARTRECELNPERRQDNGSWQMRAACASSRWNPRVTSENCGEWDSASNYKHMWRNWWYISNWSH